MWSKHRRKKRQKMAPGKAPGQSGTGMGSYLPDSATAPFSFLPSCSSQAQATAIFWSCCAAASALGIALIDGSLIEAVLWLGMSKALAWLCLPPIVRLAERGSGDPKRFWLDVALGWALVPGPVVGCLFGLVSAPLWGWPSAFLGCLVWFLLGPLVAAVEGLVIGGLLVGVVFACTGKRLDLW
jgi:hypothetical protein